MKTEKQVREEIQRIKAYRKKWPCSQDIQRECDLMIDLLQWVLEEDSVATIGKTPLTR
jgi:hypothetical protein